MTSEEKAVAQSAASSESTTAAKTSAPTTTTSKASGGDDAGGAPETVASMSSTANTGRTVTATTNKASTTKGSTTTPAATATAAAAAPATTSSGAAATPASTATSKSKKKKSQAAAAVANGSHGAQGENTGRWTAEEHRLFLQGLEQHGKGWKKIASLIKSRTVVQIRTHAQKYFQKLAKARQNGEEGDVTMEGRGGVATLLSGGDVGSNGNAGGSGNQTGKRRRHSSGTKRKAIQSVVQSAQRQVKRVATAAAPADGVPSSASPTSAPVATTSSSTTSEEPLAKPTVPTIPCVAPALAHFVLPHALHQEVGEEGQGISTNQGTISGPALEDSLFRFLTPASVATEAQLNEVARQAGANPIALPSENPSSAPSYAGEVSPTGVTELSVQPSWTDAKEAPSWFAKGEDVDALLDVADTLDWLADTGDLNETYEPSLEDDDGGAVMEDTDPDYPHHEHHISTPAPDEDDPVAPLVDHSTSVATLPHVDSNVESVVPPLPSLFEGTAGADDSIPEDETDAKAEQAVEATHADAPPSLGVSESNMDLQVFDTAMDEHDFVSTILQDTTNHDSSTALPALG